MNIDMKKNAAAIKNIKNTLNIKSTMSTLNIINAMSTMDTMSIITVMERNVAAAMTMTGIIMAMKRYHMRGIPCRKM